jgi:formiminotetrahydrofolate cyclodeaminase
MLREQSVPEFITALASRTPTPGGGGASAYGGAIGMALGSMVGNLTLGKPKYAAVQDAIREILAKAEILQQELIELVTLDAEVFEPLAQAYRLPRSTPAESKYKELRLEECLKAASSVPLQIMEKAAAAIDLHAELADKGTKMALSDVGVGALFCKAALMGASLNVYINTKLMKDRTYAAAINAQAAAMIEAFGKRADAVYAQVLQELVPKQGDGSCASF